jgi:hypothetical protein
MAGQGKVSQNTGYYAEQYALARLTKGSGTQELVAKRAKQIPPEIYQNKQKEKEKRRYSHLRNQPEKGGQTPLASEIRISARCQLAATAVKLFYHSLSTKHPDVFSESY